MFVLKNKQSLVVILCQHINIVYLHILFQIRLIICAIILVIIIFSVTNV